jgi:RNA polymerase sigma factor (sigma-70 family)
MSTALDQHRPHADTLQPLPSDTRPVTNGKSDLALLVTAAAGGDAESWAEITHRFTNLLWAVARAYRLSHDDAADVVQNTWLRLLENLRRIDHPEALPGWLATTGRREALSVLRRRTRDVVVPMDDRHFNTADANTIELDAALLTDERDAHLWTSFGRLPERDQQLLRALIACDRPSYTAVAAALDMPVGSIGPTRMRALKRLQAILDGSAYPFRDSHTQDA